MRFATFTSILLCCCALEGQQVPRTPGYDRYYVPGLSRLYAEQRSSYVLEPQTLVKQVGSLPLLAALRVKVIDQMI